MNPGQLLTPIENVLTAVLEWLHSSIGLPWAWAIVVLTLIVRMVILPLTIKQIRSMQRLQVHAPELKAIQQKYKNDRARMNEEVMKFYRENKVNPLASCLPLLLQIPVFFALFFVLRDFEKEVFPKYPDSELGWLGIVPNITQDINSHWSGYLLLVIYVGSQLASTYFMSTTMDPRQRYIFLALPFLFIFFVINFPIGLMLYWSTTNLWTVGQGLITRRMVPEAPASAEAHLADATEVAASALRAVTAAARRRPTPARLRPSRPGAASSECAAARRRARGPDGERPRATRTTASSRSEGETVGEAKWTALRELERRFPGLDKANVRFAVLSEGERGLLGVGQVPARVMARASRRRASPSAPASEEPGLARGEASRAARSRSARRSARPAASTSPRTTRSSMPR